MKQDASIEDVAFQFGDEGKRVGQFSGNGITRSIYEWTIEPLARLRVEFVDDRAKKWEVRRDPSAVQLAQRAAQSEESARQQLVAQLRDMVTDVVDQSARAGFISAIKYTDFGVVVHVSAFWYVMTVEQKTDFATIMRWYPGDGRERVIEIRDAYSDKLLADDGFFGFKIKG